MVTAPQAATIGGGRAEAPAASGLPCSEREPWARLALLLDGRVQAAVWTGPAASEFCCSMFCFATRRRAMFSAPSPGGSLFGAPAPAPAAGTMGSFFGAPAPAPAGGMGGSSLFGGAPAPAAGGGLFGAPAPAPASNPFGGTSLFGAAPAPAGGSLFGAPAPAAAPLGGCDAFTVCHAALAQRVLCRHPCPAAATLPSATAA
jgi:hypothetical protein